LARLLTPFDFGVVGIAFLVLTLVEIITETGINVFLIQREGKLKDYIDTAWIVSIFRGLFIFSVLFIFSGQIALFFANTSAVFVIQLAGLVALVRGFINPAVVTLQQKMNFKKYYLLESFIFFSETTTAIVLAVLTRRPESLLYALLVSAIIEVVLTFIVFKTRPKFKFNFEKVKTVVRRGKWVTLSKFFRYGFEEGDDIIVGKLLSSDMLGIYQNAYKVSSLPLTEISQTFGKVTFPKYTSMRKDKKRLKAFFLKNLKTISALVLPFGLVFYFFPEQIVGILLGSQWFAAADILKGLAVFGVLKAILYSTHSLFNALKKQEYVSSMAFVSFAGLILTIFPLLALYGLKGVVYSANIGLVASVPFAVFYYLKTFRNV
jgi:O-antigen/teichoic acid export membrane protein